MAVDLQNYTFASGLSDSVPEIKALLAKAAAGQWDTQRFIDAFQATAWWKANSDTAKQMIQLQASDPKEYSRQLANAKSHVQQIAAQMGVRLSDAQVSSQAVADLFQGLDDATLQQHIGALYTGPGAGPSAGGNAAQLQMQIKAMASSYGIPVTQSWVNSHVMSAIEFGNGTEAAQADLINQAKSLYPGLAQQLDSGQTVEQIAQPYMAQMAATLEMPESSITLQDAKIQRALTGALPPAAPATAIPPTGTPTSPARARPGGGSQTMGGTAPSATGAPTAAGQMMTMRDFANMLRQDPRWEKTQNARDDAFSMLHQLGHDWGLST